MATRSMNPMGTRSGDGPQPEAGAGGVGERGQAAVGRVHGRGHNGGTQPDRAVDGGVGVGHREVHGPVVGPALRQRDVAVHDARQLVLAFAQRRVAEVVRIAHHVGVPPEDPLVEAHGRVVVAGVQLEPAGGAVLAPHAEPGEVPGLPGPYGGLPGIAQDQHGAERADVHRRHDDLAALGLGLVRGDVGVVGRQVDRPGVGPARAVVLHAPGDGHAVLGEVDVIAVLGTGVLGGPAEQLAVERLAGVRVGGEQVDPAGGTGGCRITLHHDELLRSVVGCADVGPSGYPELIGLFGQVADRFDVVAVGIAHERAVVVRVVLGPHPRLVQHFGPGGHRGVEEGAHRGPIGRLEGDVGLAEALAGLAGADPEIGLAAHAEADGLAEVHDAGAAEGCQHRVVEHGTGTDVGTLDGDVVQHVPHYSTLMVSTSCVVPLTIGVSTEVVTRWAPACTPLTSTEYVSLPPGTNGVLVTRTS